MVWPEKVVKQMREKKQQPRTKQTNKWDKCQQLEYREFNKTISMKSHNNSNTFFNGFIMVFLLSGLKTIYYTNGMIILYEWNDH